MSSLGCPSVGQILISALSSRQNVIKYLPGVAFQLRNSDAVLFKSAQHSREWVGFHVNLNGSLRGFVIVFSYILIVTCLLVLCQNIHHNFLSPTHRFNPHTPRWKLVPFFFYFGNPRSFHSDGLLLHLDQMGNKLTSVSTFFLTCFSKCTIWLKIIFRTSDSQHGWSRRQDFRSRRESSTATFASLNS